MASEYTANYNLDLYVDTDKPNLRDQYNSAVRKIDQQLKTDAVNITTAQNTANDAHDIAKQAQADVATEKTERETAVNGVKDLITAETAARENADTVINNTITALDDKVAAETTARTTAIADEQTARQDADKKLNPNLDYANIVLIGDSYLCGVGTSPAQGWGYYFRQAIGSNATVTEFGNSGAGFVAKGHSDPMTGMNFSAQVDYAAQHVPDANAVDYVVIGGGWNDNGSSYQTIYDATASCVDNARSKFPNAKVVVVSLSNELHSQGAGYINANIAIVKGAHHAGADTPDMSWMWLKANSDVTSSDGIHPNATGYEMQGRMIAAAMRGSDTTPSTHMGAGFTTGGNITSTTARCAIVDGICYIQGEFTSNKWDNDTTLGTLPPAMRPARTVYELAQFVGDGTGYKEIVPIYINANNGVIQPRTPFGASYPTGSATIYLPHISFPVGIL